MHNQVLAENAQQGILRDSHPREILGFDRQSFSQTLLGAEHNLFHKCLLVPSNAFRSVIWRECRICTVAGGALPGTAGVLVAG